MPIRMLQSATVSPCPCAALGPLFGTDHAFIWPAWGNVAPGCRWCCGLMEGEAPSPLLPSRLRIASWQVGFGLWVMRQAACPDTIRHSLHSSRPPLSKCGSWLADWPCFSMPLQARRRGVWCFLRQTLAAASHAASRWLEVVDFWLRGASADLCTPTEGTSFVLLAFCACGIVWFMLSIHCYVKMFAEMWKRRVE